MSRKFKVKFICEDDDKIRDILYKLTTKIKCSYILCNNGIRKCMQTDSDYGEFFDKNMIYTSLVFSTQTNIGFESDDLKHNPIFYSLTISKQYKNEIEEILDFVCLNIIKLISSNITLNSLLKLEHHENFDDFIQINKDVLLKSGNEELVRYIKTHC